MSWTLKYAVLALTAIAVVLPALWLNLKAGAKTRAALFLRYISYALLFLSSVLAGVGLVLLAWEVLT